MAKKKEIKIDTGLTPDFVYIDEAYNKEKQLSGGSVFYPKSGNVYENGKLVGKGILNGGVLEIIYKDKK